MSQIANSEKPRDALASLRIRRDTVPVRRSAFGRMLKFLVVLGCLVLTSGGAILLAQKQGWITGLDKWLTLPEAMQTKLEVRTVLVSVEQGRSADALVVATGYLESRQQAKIGARAAGRIESLNVEEGSRVAANDLLAVLEHNDLDAVLVAVRATADRSRSEIAEQEILIEQAKLALDRAKELKAKNTIVASDFDTARFQYQSAVARKESLIAALALAEARVKEAEQLRENMYIRAPFAGTVISKDAELGESILPGGMGEASGRGSVVTIADLEHLEVDCDVKEDYISRVTEGQDAEVVVDAVPGVRFKGRVRKIIPMGDRARATIKVKVEVLDSDGRLFPEMSCNVYILPERGEKVVEATAPRVFCSEKAVVTDAASAVSGKYVFELGEDNRVRRIDVVVGESRDGRIEIVSGLSGGEKVVASPPADLKDGSLVRTAQ